MARSPKVPGWATDYLSRLSDGASPEATAGAVGVEYGEVVKLRRDSKRFAHDEGVIIADMRAQVEAALFQAASSGNINAIEQWAERFAATAFEVPPPPATGRPKKELDEGVIEELARIDCTMEEIAAAMRCSVDTLERRFADIIERGRMECRRSIRRMQFRAAQEGNVTMMIWLGKMQLGQRETVRQELSGIDGLPQKIIVEYADTATADK